MAILAILAIYGPYGHDQHLNQYARYGYPGKEHTNTNSIVLRSAQSDNPIRSYDCFTILGRNGATEILKTILEIVCHGEQNGGV